MKNLKIGCVALRERESHWKKKYIGENSICQPAKPVRAIVQEKNRVNGKALKPA